MNASAFACQPCGKSFSGPEPYQQHLASERHKRKLQTGSLEVCTPCGMTFTGPTPYRAHMVGAGHAKVMAKRAMVSTELPAPKPQALDKMSGTVSQGGVSCHLCNIPSFPSMQAAFSHYESQYHMRNKLMAACGTSVQPAHPAPSTPLLPVAPPPFVPTPKIPSSMLICRADEDFAEFCKKRGLYNPDSQEVH